MSAQSGDPAAAYRSPEEARRYRDHHGATLGRRLRTHFERRHLARVLDRLGPIDLLLDLPCGSGRLWPVLLPRARKVVAGDASAEMIRASLGPRPAALVASLPHLPFRDRAFDVVFCHRLLHHFADPADRRAILRELGRVANRAVVVSFWVTGNRRARREEEKRRIGLARRRTAVSLETFTADAGAAGLSVESVHWKLKFWSPLATAILRT